MLNLDFVVPGRICLFGEHSDWASEYLQSSKIIPSAIVGQAIVAGIDQGIYARVSMGENSNKFIYDSGIDNHIEMISIEDFDTMKERMRSNDFNSYAIGAAYHMYKNYNVGPIRITVLKQTLPLKKGLSSSAAVCVMVAKAFNIVYDLRLSTEEIMDIAYCGEHNAGSNCGRLDQVCAYGNQLTQIFFRNDGNIVYKKIQCPKKIYGVYADLKSFKNTKKILSSLQEEMKQPNNYNLFYYFEKINKDIVNRATEYILDDDPKSLGELMTYSQKEFNKYVKPYSIYLNSPILDYVLNDDYIQSLTYGGKGVGSQGDGSVQFIARNENCQNILCRHLETRLGMKAYPFTLR